MHSMQHKTMLRSSTLPRAPLKAGIGVPARRDFSGTSEKTDIPLLPRRSKAPRSGRSIKICTASFTQERGPEVFTTGQQLPPQIIDLKQEFQKAYRSTEGEHKCELDEIEGRIPATLQGTLFRNGPGLFERGDQPYAHNLDGDGHVTSFAFSPSGRVFYRSRFVNTWEKQKEEEANAVLFRNAFGTQRNGGALRNAFDIHLKNPANTNAFMWGGRLFALWEAGAPYELDPFSLKTLEGSRTLGGWIDVGSNPSSTGNATLDRLLNFGHAVTAHPHIVPAKGGECERLVFWNWRSNVVGGGEVQLNMQIAEFDLAWQKLRQRSITIPDCVINSHDCAVTDSSYIFFQSSSTFDNLSFLLGLKATADCAEVGAKATKVHIVDRTGNNLKVCETEACAMNHHANAHDEGDEAVVLSSGWGPQQLQQLQAKNGDVPPVGSLKLSAFGDYTAMPRTALWEHRINCSTGEVKMTPLYSKHSIEFPCVHPSVYSSKPQFVYFTAASKPEEVALPLQAFGKLNLETGETDMWHAGPRCFCGELVFAPPVEDHHAMSPSHSNGNGNGSRRRTQPSAEESGHLLGIVYDSEKDRSSLVVMEAANFSKGPVARIWLKHHLPHDLHGSFSPDFYGP